jgi:putative oxidoreductase
MAALGLVVLRLTLATALMAHGVHQLFGMLGGPGVGPGGLSTTAGYFSSIGVDPGFPAAVLAGSVQVIGGFLIAIGLLTRWASLAVIGYLAVIIWKDQSRWGFFMNWMLDPTRGHGFEYSVLLIGCLLCLVLAGGGEFSIDGRRAHSAASRASARARLRTRQ